jgi:hypothetical protein
MTVNFNRENGTMEESYLQRTLSQNRRPIIMRTSQHASHRAYGLTHRINLETGRDFLIDIVMIFRLTRTTMWSKHCSKTARITNSFDNNSSKYRRMGSIPNHSHVG